MDEMQQRDLREEEWWDQYCSHCDVSEGNHECEEEPIKFEISSIFGPVVEQGEIKE